MASLRQQHRYGLSCGQNTGGSGHRTLFHVRLTDTAIRALEAHRKLKESFPGKPSICFQGNQGDGREQLEGQGVIQDKITVCATDDSYQMTRERMSRVEKDSWSRSAIEIKPGATHQSVHRRLVPLCTSDNSFQKQSANNRRNGCIATATHKPFRERIIHLLALKAYRKPELLLWMERERASPRDKAGLGGILEEVAKANPKDGSYVLRDHFYRLVQEDWPNYSEEERQLIGQLLARKLLPNSANTQPKNLPANLSVLKTSGDRNHSSVNNPAGKRLLASESLERLAVKRQRLAEKRSQQQLGENGLLSHNSHNATSPSVNASSPSKTEFPQADARIGIHNAPNGFSEGRKQETKVEPQSDPNCPQQPLISILCKKKKSKKHKDKERDWLTHDHGDGWLETSKLKQKPSKTDNSEISSTAEEKPDYVLMYGPIMSLEQRQSYQEDFSSEYDEYKDLHSRIATITHMFVQLGSKIKSLSPGTAEYKIMEDQILEKYSKYQKKFPGYREEKKRCKYLHEKLSYIKQLIIDYDASQASCTGENIHSG